MPVSAPPERGSLVEVRQRRFLVVEVQQSIVPLAVLYRNGSHPHYLVTLASVDEEARGDVPRPDGFDAPRRLDAFLDAVRWGAASSADMRALHAPFCSGNELEDDHLDAAVRPLPPRRKQRAA